MSTTPNSIITHLSSFSYSSIHEALLYTITSIFHINHNEFMTHNFIARNFHPISNRLREEQTTFKCKACCNKLIFIIYA